MISIAIGGMSVPLEKASEGWINQMIADARKRGVPACVQVVINDPAAAMTLATPGCGGAGGGGRQPNVLELRILEAWRRRGLASGSFAPGELIAFLRELARLT